MTAQRLEPLLFDLSASWFKNIGFKGPVHIALINTFAISYNKKLTLQTLYLQNTSHDFDSIMSCHKKRRVAWAKFLLFEETECSNNPNWVCQIWVIDRIISVVKIPEGNGLWILQHSGIMHFPFNQEGKWAPVTFKTFHKQIQINTCKRADRI